MCQFIESIRIEDGKIDLIDYHNERFNNTRKLFFCVDDEWDLKHFVRIPQEFKKGLVKCRIVYDIEIRDIQFLHYEPKSIRSLKLVNASIRYAYKAIDRLEIEQLKASVSPADEVLIVNDGKISDTSFSNIIFQKSGLWFTSDTPLLAGVRREYLLSQGLIEEVSILPNDLKKFDSFMLINALLDFDKARALPIKNILEL